MSIASYLQRDLGQVLRSLADRPGFAFSVIGTLALAIAANTSVFSLVHGVLLKQLPFSEPDEVVVITMEKDDGDLREAGISPGDLSALMERSQLLDKIGYYAWGGMALGGADQPRDLANNQVSADYLAALGVRPRLGSGFSGDADAREVILSHALWRSAFGGRGDIIGQTALFDEEPYTIVGVMPRTMRYPSDTVQFWLPRQQPLDPNNHAARYLIAVGRLADGVSLEDFGAEATAIGASLQGSNPDTNTTWNYRVRSLEDNVVGDVRQSLWILMAMVALVMVIACANVANVLLARGVHRQRELAVRVAVGARTVHLVSLVLTEALVFSLVGAAVGLLLAYAAIDAVGLLASLNLPRLDEVSLNPAVIAFNLGLAFVAALGCGLLPALKVARVAPMDALRSSGKGVNTLGSSRLQKSFSVLAVALSMVLLIVSGVLVKSFIALQGVELGFDPQGRVSVQLWRNEDTEARLSFFQDVLREMEEDSRIEAAAATNYLPLDYITGWNQPITVAGREEPEAKSPLMLTFMGDITGTMGFTRIAGDTPNDGGSDPVVWLNREAATRYFGAVDDAVGQQISMATSNADDAPVATLRIAGVLADVHYRSIEDDPEPAVLLPTRMRPTVNLNFVARGSAPLNELSQATLDAVRRVDPTQAVYRDIINADLVDAHVADERVYLQLVLAFSFVALTLACLGVYAVIAYSVGRRQAEFGLRAALGATRRRIMAVVLSESARHLAIGLLFGLGLAMVLLRWLQNELYAVGRVNPDAIALAALVLAAVTALASWIPANRAARANPIDALRCE